MGAQIHANGSSSNGHSQASQVVGARQLIDRSEFVRVIQQSLLRLGYSQSAELLQEESGIEMQPRHVTSFQDAILEGRWADSLELLPSLASDADTLKQARFWILRQKYVEALEQENVPLALHTLRVELAPLQVNTPEVRMLAGLLLQSPDSKAQAGADWSPAQPITRPMLVDSLQRLLPPNLMVPDGRLEQLLEQALDAQIQACPYYNVPPTSLSLLSNYQAGMEQLPTQPAQVLEGHNDEIWHVTFSHDGRLVGSASRDGTACLWRVKASGDAVLLHTLQGSPESLAAEKRSLSFLAFSPDDGLLLTCGAEPKVRLWDVSTGRLLHEYNDHRDGVTAVAWLPCGRRFVSSSLDRSLRMYDVDGAKLRTWRLAERINDLIVCPDGKSLLYIEKDKKINVLRLNEEREVLTLTDGPAITNLAVSPGGAYLIVHMVSHTLHLWPLSSITRRLDSLAPATSARNAGDVVGMPQKPSMEYKVEGGRAGRFIIRSCFGGNHANFIASGSEDCRVYIWHRASGDLLARLEGHSGTVNSVAWNPANPHMLASASDDRTVRIWLAPAALERAA